MRSASPRSDGRPANLRELFRYAKDGRIRVYGLRLLDEAHAELWVVSGHRGEKRRRLASFGDGDEAGVFLEEVQRELRSGGWMEM